MKLAILARHNKPFVFDTNLDNVIDSDSKVIKENIKVIMAFKPQKAYGIIQAI